MVALCGFQRTQDHRSNASASAQHVPEPEWTVLERPLLPAMSEAPTWLDNPSSTKLKDVKVRLMHRFERVFAVAPSLVHNIDQERRIAAVPWSAPLSTLYPVFTIVEYADSLCTHTEFGYASKLLLDG